MQHLLSLVHSARTQPLDAHPWRAQTMETLEKLNATLVELGGTLDNVVSVRAHD